MENGTPGNLFGLGINRQITAPPTSRSHNGVNSIINDLKRIAVGFPEPQRRNGSLLKAKKGKQGDSQKASLRRWYLSWTLKKE